MMSSLTNQSAQLAIIWRQYRKSSGRRASKPVGKKYLARVSSTFIPGVVKSIKRANWFMVLQTQEISCGKNG